MSDPNEHLHEFARRLVVELAGTIEKVAYKLANELVKKALYQDGRAEVWDRIVPGLVIRQYKGSASYCVKYKIKGKQYMKTIASTDAIKIQDARRIALLMKRCAARGGEDADAIRDNELTKCIFPEKRVTRASSHDVPCAPQGIPSKQAPSKRRPEQWDKVVRGLVVRQNKDSSSVYLLKYWFEGKQRFRTLGSTEVMTLEDAREHAAQIKQLARSGEDPESLLEEIRRRSHKKQDRNTVNTTQLACGVMTHSQINFADFCELYIERYSKVKKKTWQEDWRRIRGYMLPAWENRSVHEITHTDVLDFHANMGKRVPYQANRVREQLCTMFKLAKEWGYVPDHARNPVSGVPKFHEIPRERFITPDEMKHVAAALNDLRNETAKAALWLLVYTALRKDEVLKLRHDELDLTAGEIRLSARRTKTKRSYVVPLSSAAKAVLKPVVDKRDPLNPYVFVGTKPGENFKRLDKTWAKVCKQAGLTDIRLHDIRRTCGSWLAQSGQPLHLIKDVLNHADIESTLIYSRFQTKHKRDALEKYSQQIAEAIGDEDRGEHTKQTE